jgi:amino acid transporter
MVPQIPAWIFSLVMIVIITAINCKGIKLAAGSNTILIIIQLVFLCAFIIFMLKWLTTGNGAATLVDIKGFYNGGEVHKLGWGTIFTATSALCLCFLGFDAITTLAEEAYNPTKNIGRAIIIACIGAGAFFVVVGYLSQLSWPDAWSQIKSPDTGAVELIRKVAGSTMSYVFAGIYCVGCFGSGIASQSSAARLLYGMGRDKGLPSFLGIVNEKHGTPIPAIFVVAAIGCISLVIDLLSIASIINFGALLAFTMVNICVIKHYFIDKKMRKGWDVFRYLIAPLIGACIAFFIWVNLDSKAMILGAVWSTIGIIVLAITTKGFKKAPINIDFSE